MSEQINIPFTREEWLDIRNCCADAYMDGVDLGIQDLLAPLANIIDRIEKNLGIE